MNPSTLSPLQKALHIIERLESQLAAVENRQHEPIAIVGYSCRFPGPAKDPESFWELLRSGRDATTEIPPDRWDAREWFHPDPNTPGKIATRSGCFLTEIDQFDPQFFGISPREARHMDPQQRLLLEVTWEAIERTGIAADRLPSQRTGVFVGIGQNDYASLSLHSGVPTAIDALDGTGNGLCFSAGRLSYILGLQGPTMAVDTACSSALTALHLACQSLRTAECDIALAGGVHLITSPEVTLFLSRTGALATDGRCKTFDARADGFGRGEGAAMVVLKRLSDAIAANDTITAVIQGSAITHDGPSSGFTVPNGQSQATLLRQALKNAGLKGDQIDYVEAHGTGTRLGDPLEVEALAQVFGPERKQKLRIGSVKTVIGHLEAAAGMAGLLKTLLALHHEEIPRHLNMTHPNPEIPWERIPIEVVTQPHPWPKRPTRRFAGISSFGMSGTNVHIIVGDPPDVPPVAETTIPPTHHLFTLSARTPKALGEYAARMATGTPHPSLAEICHTTASGRSPMEHRLALTATTPGEWSRKLATFAKTGSAAGLHVGAVRQEFRPKIAFLFTGQGSQYHGMGQELHATQPVFRAALERCDAILRPHLPIPLLEILYGPPTTKTDLTQTGLAQPALFALHHALTELWKSWGIEPMAVLGHSVGEYSAAMAANVFSLEEGLSLIARRGQLMNDLPPGGAMLAITGDPEQLADFLTQLPESVSIAADNGPGRVVLSGPHQSLEPLAARLEKQQVRHDWLTVSHAFHSHLMDPMLNALGEAARAVNHTPPKIPLIANLTGQAIPAITPDYWPRHARQTVRFAEGMQTLLALGCNTLIEIGPHPVLIGLGQTVVNPANTLWLASLKRGNSPQATLNDSLAQLYVSGIPLTWDNINPTKKRVVLPTYPFQRRRYWLDKPTPKIGQHHQAISFATMAQWFYQVEWHPLPPMVATQPIHGDWLIFGPPSATGEAIARHIRTLGQNCFIVHPGPKLQRTGESVWQINPADPAEFYFFLNSLTLKNPARLQGVLSLWTTPASEPTPETDQACVGTLLLLQALLATHAAPPYPTLWIVTKGAMAVTPGDPLSGLFHAPLWGLGKCIGLEHPEYNCSLLDLDPESDQESGQQVVATLGMNTHETQIAWRRGQTYGPRLVTAPPTPAQWSPPRTDRTYLITGGLGAIGHHVTQWLVALGVKHLCLIARRDPSPEKMAELENLRNRGIQIVTRPVDVADPKAMQELFEHIRATMPPLGGVFHTAGVDSIQDLRTMPPETLTELLRPKTLGSWFLHQLTQNDDLDCFVGFSSIASVWGSLKQGHYAAANHFLDGLSHFRNHHGLAGHSINWGPWAGGGLASDEILRYLSDSGLTALEPHQGIAALERLLATKTAQTVVANVAWDRLKPLLERKQPNPFLGNITLSPTIEPEQAVSLGFRQHLEQATPEKGREMLFELIQAEVARILELEPDEQPDPKRGFFDMGMDSLMAMELKNRMQTTLGQTLPATLIFDTPNSAALSQWIARTIFKWPDLAPTITPQGAGTKEIDLEEQLATLNNLLKKAIPNG